MPAELIGKKVEITIAPNPVRLDKVCHVLKMTGGWVKTRHEDKEIVWYPLSNIEQIKEI